MELRLVTVCGLLALAALVHAVGAAVCGTILAVQIALIVLRPVIAHLPPQATTQLLGNARPVPTDAAPARV